MPNIVQLSFEVVKHYWNHSFCSYHILIFIVIVCVQSNVRSLKLKNLMKAVNTFPRKIHTSVIIPMISESGKT